MRRGSVWSSLRAWSAGTALAVEVLVSVGCGSSDLSDHRLQIGRILASQGGSMSVLSAHFVTATDCTRKAVGLACSHLQCSGSPDTESDAGTLEFTGGTIPLGTTLTPRGGGLGYFSQFIAKPLFQAGDMISVKASGGALPAFQRLARAPDPVAVGSPSCPNGFCGTLDFNKDLAVAWTGRAGLVELAFHVAGSTAGFDRVECRYPAADQRASIPAQVLSMLPKSAGLQVGRLSISSASIDSFTAGTMATEVGLYDVSLEAGYTNPP